MLLQSEILKIAEKEGVLPDTIDKDWVLGHFLAGLYQNEWAQSHLIFKGGTCLKKCYFENYRFSEDLDFTINNHELQIKEKMLQEVCDNVSKQVGILFSKFHVNLILWYDKQVGYSSHIRFWGANHKKGHQPSIPNRWQTEIKLEMISYELMVQQPVLLPLLDHYSDSGLFNQTRIPCYSLSEIIAEKFRALIQRSYPAPRDYYDLWYLLRKRNLSFSGDFIDVFKKKATYKGINFQSWHNFFDAAQTQKVREAWNNSLSNHLKENELPDFEQVLSELQEICNNYDWK